MIIWKRKRDPRGEYDGNEHDGNKHIWESVRSICSRTYHHKNHSSHTNSLYFHCKNDLDQVTNTYEVKVCTLQADIYMWNVTSAHLCVISKTTIASLHESQVRFQPRYQKITVFLRRLISRIKINNPSPLENLPPLKLSRIKYHKQWKKNCGLGSWLEFSNRNEYLTVKNACKFSHLKMSWVSEGKENDILYLCWWRHLLSNIRGGLKKFMLKNKDMICLLSVNACVFETTEKFAHAGKAFFFCLLAEVNIVQNTKQACGLDSFTIIN